MSDFSRLLREINLFIDGSLDFLEVPSIRFVLIFILILYSTAFVPMLNQNLNKLFDNLFVKIGMLVIIAFIGSKDPVLALLFAIAFILSLLKTNNYGEYGTVDIKDYEPEGKVSNSTQQVGEEPDLNPQNNQQGSNMNNNQQASHMNNNQQGSNMNNNQCLNECALDGQLSSDQCTPISAFNNEMNAQGMNCPTGGYSSMAGTAIF